MPYKDVARQRRYNIAWNRSDAAANTPLARRVESIIRQANRPIAKREILAQLSTTANCLGTTLTHLHRAGRITKIGDRRTAVWIASATATASKRSRPKKQPDARQETP